VLAEKFDTYPLQGDCGYLDW